ncbi:MAG: TlpA disulfide reductase family protein, partial [Planctomycetota bacterium]|nr:TlpA disulfide reductase family protein [Planctomycetota bacterium]
SAASLALAQGTPLSDKDFQTKAQKLARRITLKLSENQRDASLYKKQLKDLEDLLNAAANPNSAVVLTVRLFKASTHLELRQGKECLAELAILEKTKPTGRMLSNIYQYRARLYIRQHQVAEMEKLVAKAKKAPLDDEVRDAIIGSYYLLKARELSKLDKRDELIRTIKDAEAARVDYKTVSLMKREIARCAFAIGKAFPDFNVKDVDGNDLSLSAHKGKVVLVDFWATWCGPCRSELPELMEIYKKYHDKGFDIIGISLDENEKRFKSFVKRQEISWPQYFDGKGWRNALARRYLIDSLPAAFLIDQNGNILAKDIRVDALEAAIKKALAKKSPKE